MESENGTVDGVVLTQREIIARLGNIGGAYFGDIDLSVDMENRLRERLREMHSDGMTYLATRKRSIVPMMDNLDPCHEMDHFYDIANGDALDYLVMRLTE